MSHKGRIAPVLFRRDLNLNVENNNDGWARRTIVHWAPSGTTGPGTFWDPSNWDLGPDTYPSLGVILWQSEVRHSLAIDWWVEFEVQIANNREYDRALRMVTDVVGTIVEITYEAVNFPLYGPQLATHRRITYYDPDFYSSLPVGYLQNTFRAKLWRDGPPH